MSVPLWPDVDDGDSADESPLEDLAGAPSSRDFGPSADGLPDDPGDFEQHLNHAHGLSPQAYRECVLEDALHSWPQPISPQLLRARLAGYKQELTDRNYRVQACACCAREKRSVKLREVVFPPLGAPECPAWLPFNQKEWATQGVEWHRKVDALLNVEQYLERVFCASQRVESAAKALDALREGRTHLEVHGTEEEAQAWLTRVQAWVENMRGALREDSVLAPGCRDQYWLLYRPSCSSVSATGESGDGSLTCLLCKHCFGPLRKVVALRSRGT